VTATGTAMRPLELGEANDRMVEVVAGLQQGDRVSLLAPETAAGAPDRRNALQPR
jgi:hypothetical protein